MTPLGQGAMGLAVALGFAVLGTRRTSGMAMLCAAQAVVVAIGALAQGDFGVVLVACAEAGIVVWLGFLLPLPLGGGRGPHRRRDRSAAETDTPGVMVGEGQLPAAFVNASSMDAAGRPAPTMTEEKRRLRRTPCPDAHGRVPHVHGTYVPLAAGALLAALAATIPETGLPLAVLLLGLLVVATRRLAIHQAMGIAVAQNGLGLAAVAAGLSGWRLDFVALPWLPALAFGALWLGADRGRTALLLASRIAGRIDAALCGMMLLIVCALPWQLGAHGQFWRLAPLSVHTALLLAALAAAASWAQGDTTQIWGGRIAVLAGSILAVLSTAPLLSWIGMTLATIGAAAGALPARAETWRRLRLGCTGLGLALFGLVVLHAGTVPVDGVAADTGGGIAADTGGGIAADTGGGIAADTGGGIAANAGTVPGYGIATHAGTTPIGGVAADTGAVPVSGIRAQAGTVPIPAPHTGTMAMASGEIALTASTLAIPINDIALAGSAAPLPAIACAMLGYGALAALAPELTVAAIALILRLHPPSADALLLGLGLAALAVAALGLWTGARGWQRHTLPLVCLGQGGAAVFAFGLGTDAGNLAGLLQLSLLALTQCALLLAPEDGLDRLGALAGLAGLPPFGLFPSLALILLATAQSLPWLLLPLGMGLAAIAWAILEHLPPERRLRISPAWVPLALLLLVGFAMPDSLLAWFRLAAR